MIRERLEHHTGTLRRSGARDKAAAQLSGGGLLMQLQLGRLELALRSLHDSQLTGRGVSALAGIAHGIGAAFVGNPAALIKAGGQLLGVGSPRWAWRRRGCCTAPRPARRRSPHRSPPRPRPPRPPRSRTSARGKLAAIGGGAAAAAAALGGAADANWDDALRLPRSSRCSPSAMRRRLVPAPWPLSIGSLRRRTRYLRRGAARAERRDRQPAHRLRRARAVPEDAAADRPGAAGASAADGNFAACSGTS